MYGVKFEVSERTIILFKPTNNRIIYIIMHILISYFRYKGIKIIA